MKLIDNFYHILHLHHTPDGDICGSVKLMPTHAIYEGHFPGHPIVPGMCTLTIVRECLSRLLRKQVKFTNIKECKFITSVTPSENCTLNLHFSLSNDGKLKGYITNATDGNTVIKLKATIN